MRGPPVMGMIRVQEIVRGDSRRQYTIVDLNGQILPGPDRFLRSCAGGTDRTYAYLLVDHLRWLEENSLTAEDVSFEDLKRYMAAMGAEYAGPFGSPWRTGKLPFSSSSLASLAACLKRYYLFEGLKGSNKQLVSNLKRTRLPSLADRRRLLMAHTTRDMSANPLSPKRIARRSPKLPPVGARDAMSRAANTARDRLVVTWLADGGFRIGELCSLHLVDLHIRDNAACGECVPKHLHICHRETNPNRARVKTKPDWTLIDGTVHGGHVRRVSPAMVHTYFDYMTTEYPDDEEHGMLLVQLHGTNRGKPLAPAGAREMFHTLSERAGLGKVRPHSFRHQFATNVLKAANGNAVIARDAGGWASATTVEEVYGHMDVHDPVFVAALLTAWNEEL